MVQLRAPFDITISARAGIPAFWAHFTYAQANDYFFARKRESYFLQASFFRA